LRWSISGALANNQAVDLLGALKGAAGVFHRANPIGDY
jgi:hypothetical protein